MTRRLTFIDEAPGETRGVVLLGGRPERLLLRRHEDDPRLLLGARLAARVVEVEASLATAFLDVGGGAEAILSYKPTERPVRGALIDVEIRSEPRRGKLASVRMIGPAEGEPRLLASAPSIRQQLKAFVSEVEPEVGAAARAAADEAEGQVFDVAHALSGGGEISIEPTRALTAIDVDIGARKGGDSKRVTRQANLSALSEGARLLRLKGLGGLVVFDLAGRGHDGNALLAAARAAFAPDNPGVAFGPISRFGALEIAIPRRIQPVLERLSRADGRPSDRTVAQRLVRRLQAEAMAQPGARLVARCAPSIAAEARPLVDALAAVVGARVDLDPQPAHERESFEVSLG